jgi:hypothetical protein
MEESGMACISEGDVVAAVGPVDELIMREALKTGASVDDLRRAVALARGPSRADETAYGALRDELKRLVDLVSVVSDRAA